MLRAPLAHGGTLPCQWPARILGICTGQGRSECCLLEGAHLGLVLSTFLSLALQRWSSLHPHSLEPTWGWSCPPSPSLELAGVGILLGS